MWILGDTALPSFQLMDNVSRRVKPDAPVADDGCAAPDSETVGSRNASDILCAYAPGRGADLWPEGTAKLLPAGSHIVFEMHYSKPRGQTAKDRSRAALVFAHASPNASVLAGLQGPLQTRVHHGAPVANALCFLNLEKCRSRVADWEEELRVLVEAGCAITPIHADQSLHS